MPNNILVRGGNRIDKSGLIKYILNDFHSKKGFQTVDIRRGKEKFGFRIETSNNNSIVFASSQLLSAYRVGAYRVNVSGLENVIQSLFDVSNDEFLYIDEIGRMQLLSLKFKKLIEHYLELPNVFLATMPDDYEDDFIRKIESRNDVILVENFSSRMYKQTRDLVYRCINGNLQFQT